MNGILIPLFIMRYGIWLMVALWILHLSQRKSRDEGEAKRTSTLLWTLVLMGLWGCSWIFARFGFADLFFLPLFFLAAAVIAWQRKRFLPYRLRCPQCGKPLALKTILYQDSNACDACSAAHGGGRDGPSSGDQGGLP